MRIIVQGRLDIMIHDYIDIILPEHIETTKQKIHSIL